MSLGQDAADAHVDSGFWSVAYLRRDGAVLHPDGAPLVGQGSDGGFGAPPRVRIDRRLSRVPTLVVVSSYRSTGETVESLDLVRLGERPRVVAADILTRLDSESVDGRFSCRVRGRLRLHAPDGAFTVAYAGDFHLSRSWTWNGEVWQASTPDFDPYAKCPSR